MGYFSIPSNKVFLKENKGKGGRPPYDYLLMFKIVILQKMYNLSDDQTEYQINVSSLRFLGLGLSDVIPDAKTIWNFKNKLTEADAGKLLFDVFNKEIEKAGLIKHEVSYGMIH